MKPHFLTLALFHLTVSTSCAQGLIQFNNGLVTRFQLCRFTGICSNVPGTTSFQYRDLRFGFFWGTHPRLISDRPVLPLGTMTSTPGVMSAPDGNNYPIPGTQPGQIIYGQVKGLERLLW